MPGRVRYHQVLWATALLAATACNTEEWALDVGGTATATGAEQGEEQGEDAEDEGADEGSTGEIGDGGGDGGGIPCGYSGMLGGDYDISFPPRDEEHPDYRLFDPSEDGDCDFDGIFDPSQEPDETALGTGQEFEVFVYRPDDGEGNWPEGLDERPAVFFGPANGTDYRLVDDGAGLTEASHRYRDLIGSLVSDGFVVFGINPDGGTMTSGGRRAALACTMIWARNEWEDRQRLSEFMVLAGHSRSGGATYLLTEHLAEEAHLPEHEPGIDEWRQCGLVTYAQRYGTSAGSSETTIDPITRRSSPPFLSLLGTIDEDTRNQGILAYDNRHAETSQGAVDDWDELVVVVHGQFHRAWGGLPGVGGASGETVFGPFFSRQFLQWQMMGEDASRRRFMDLIDVGVDRCAFEDLDLADSERWGGELEIYYSGCTAAEPPDVCEDPQVTLVGADRPLIYANFGQGAEWPGAEREPIDTLDHSVNGCAMWTEGTEDGAYLHTVMPSNSTSGGTIAVTTLMAQPGTEGPGPCVCVAHPSVLNHITASGLPDACSAPGGYFGSEHFDAHDGTAMLVHFGDDLGPVSIRWSLVDGDGAVIEGRSLSSYSHVSVRLGNVVTDPSGCSSGWIPDEFEVNAYLENGDGIRHMVPLGRQIESDQRDVDGCRSAQFMHTLRIPLAYFCDQGEFSIDDVRAFILEFPDDGESHVALVDSIELVRDPDGAALWPAYAACGSMPEVPDPCPTAASSSWNCIADDLVALETSCSGEPTSGECDVLDTEHNPVPLPEVDDLQQGTYDGWVVHIPKGWVRDPQDPTEDELESILGRCIAACELEYADDPFVSADCSASDAFFEPTLRSTTSVGAQASIPNAYAHGEDLFTGESLDCDLRTDCTLAFDENLGPARLRRFSPAAEPLHRGEEWLITVAGDMEAGSSYAVQSFSDASAAISGTVGYSRCAAGNAQTCPFYLASMELQLDEPLQLDLECDSEPQSHELTELTIRLVQPAFGVAEEGTSVNAFPPGGLVLEAVGVVDSIPFSSRRPIEQPVYLFAADGLLTIQAAIDGFVLDFDVPCNGLLADVSVGWSLAEDMALEGPPTLGIEHLDTTIACPDDLALTLGWASDPDLDYESLQWIVDGVLLEDEYPTLTVTESHEITAVLRDSRGATGSATASVTCQ